MDVSVSKLRTACERLHLAQVKLRATQDLVDRENSDMKCDVEELAQLRKFPPIAHRNHSAADEIEMLRRILREEAMSLSVIERSLAAQLRFGEIHVQSLAEVKVRIDGERQSRAASMARVQRIAHQNESEQKALREIEARLRDQKHDERTKEAILLDRDSAIHRLRSEADFSERVRRGETDHLRKLHQWLDEATTENTQLLEIARSLGLDGADSRMADMTPASSPALSRLASLRHQSARTLQQVVASIQQLEKAYQSA